MSSTITFDTDVDITLPNARDAAKVALAFTTIFLQGELRKETPKDTGNLASGWRLVPEGDLEYNITNSVRYAMWVLKGTGIYGPKHKPITPKNGTYLKFTPKGGSKPIFVRSVKGQKPNDFVGRALASTESHVDGFIQRALREHGVG